MHIFNVNGIGEKWCNLIGSEPCDAATDPCDQKDHLGMLLGEAYKPINVWFNSLYATLHCWDGITLSLQSHALAPNGTELFNSDTRGAASMGASQVAAENEDFILAKTIDKLRCDTKIMVLHHCWFYLIIHVF